MGAVNFVVGSEGCTYTSKAGKDYQLSGWTLEAIARQERWLEQRAFDSLSRMPIDKEDKAAAYALLAKDFGVRMSCSYGSDVWDESLSKMTGVAHFFSVLAKCGMPEATALLQEDGEGVQEAVFKANPRYRATAENPKSEAGA